MEIRDYATLYIEGHMNFTLPTGAIAADYTLLAEGTKDTEQTHYAVEKVELRLQLTPGQLPLLHQWQPEISDDCRVLVLLGTPALRDHLLLTDDSTPESWAKDYGHLLRDLEHYVWSQALGAVEASK